jgi:hypothetical protein
MKQVAIAAGEVSFTVTREWMPHPSRSSVRPTSTDSMSSSRTVRRNIGNGPKRTAK